jgi:gliding motility-associated-like protein
MIIAGIPFQLHGSGNGTYLWSPATGLSGVNIPNPVGQLDHDQDYLLTVTTVEGCVSTDLIRLKVMEGPAIYVPTGFTPNGDGKNDLLRPVYVGITQLEKFKVYNRWGQEVFSTKSMYDGWDGSIDGKIQGSGSYIWFVQAKNYLGQPVFLKGLETLIR